MHILVGVTATTHHKPIDLIVDVICVQKRLATLASGSRTALEV